MNDIVLTSQRSKKSWSVKECCEELTPELKSVLPVVHAFSGCDTTSAIFGYGKAKLLKLFKGRLRYQVLPPKFYFKVVEQ